MVYDQSSEACADSQADGGIHEINSILDTIDATLILDRLNAYRRTGRRGYPLTSLWRAYLASFILNLPSTNALIRRLQDDLELRVLCGFSTLPHRATFNRFITRLASHSDLVESCLSQLTDELAGALPDFGRKVSIDSTVVRTHANPNRKNKSDPEASWTFKNSASGKDGEKEHFYGYKYHALADATHDLPIIGFVTTANRNDSPFLPGLLDKAADTHDWFAPKYVIADRGYDSKKNHKEVLQRGAVPIIHIKNILKNRKQTQERLSEGIYTYKGVPTCLGMVPMEYVLTDPKRGHLYRCPQEGCHLKNRQGVRHCHDEHWVNRTDDPGRFGPVRRDSQEWRTYMHCARVSSASSKA